MQETEKTESLAKFRDRIEREIEKFRADAERFRADAEKFRAETEKLRAETESIRRESEEKSAAFRTKMEAETRRLRAETESIRRESEKKSAAFRAEMEAETRRMNKHFGGYINNASEVLEQEFADALLARGKINGMKVDEVLVRYQGKRGEESCYEYDLVAFSGDGAAVGEVKSVMRAEDVRRFVERRLSRFARNRPRFLAANPIYGMVAGAQFAEGAEDAARDLGLIVLRLKNRRLVVKNESQARTAH